MSDFEKLINESDLIEWIMETYPDWCVGDVRGIVDHVDEMPSAQPEIVRCKDCKCWDISGYCVDFMTQDENGFCSWAERRTEDEIQGKK